MDLRFVLVGDLKHQTGAFWDLPSWIDDDLIRDTENLGGAITYCWPACDLAQCPTLVLAERFSHSWCDVHLAMTRSHGERSVPFQCPFCRSIRLRTIERELAKHLLPPGIEAHIAAYAEDTRRPGLPPRGADGLIDWCSLESGKAYLVGGPFTIQSSTETFPAVTVSPITRWTSLHHAIVQCLVDPVGTGLRHWGEDAEREFWERAFRAIAAVHSGIYGTWTNERRCTYLCHTGPQEAVSATSSDPLDGYAVYELCMPESVICPKGAGKLHCAIFRMRPSGPVLERSEVSWRLTALRPKPISPAAIMTRGDHCVYLYPATCSLGETGPWGDM